MGYTYTIDEILKTVTCHSVTYLPGKTRPINVSFTAKCLEEDTFNVEFGKNLSRLKMNEHKEYIRQKQIWYDLDEFEEWCMSRIRKSQKKQGKYQAKIKAMSEGTSPN